MVDNEDNNRSADTELPQILDSLSKPKAVEALAKSIAQVLANIWRTKRVDGLLALATASSASAALFLLKFTDFPGYTYTFRGTLIFGGVCFAWLVLRLIRFYLAVPSTEIARPLTPPVSIPTAIKGGMAYAVSEGQLFAKLEREHNIADLVSSVTSPDFPLTVLRGQSGVGKTSLLHAGLEYCLQQRHFDCIYWEAKSASTPLELGRWLESHTHLSLNDDPNTLLDKVQKPLVLIIDQFEQLRLQRPEHQGLFTFISNLCRSFGRHQIHLVLAFRDEYLGPWLDFEESLLLSEPIHVVNPRPFSTDQAASVMATILAHAGIPVDSEVLREYASKVADDETGVSPVAIGIGLLVLANWHAASGRKQIASADFITARGARGIYGVHLRYWFGPDHIRETERTAFLKALHSELVTSSGSIKMTGVTPDIIASSSKLKPDHVLRYFEVLSSNQARILEKIEDSGGTIHYRLANEQLAPVLTELTLELPVLVDSVSIRFDEQYHRWKRDPHKSNLLRGRLLRTVLDAESRVIREPEINEKARFLNESRRARTRARWHAVAIAGTTAVVLGIAAAITIPKWAHTAKITRQHQLLESWSLPPDLFERQSQLDSLSIGQPKMQHLQWLQSTSIHELTIQTTQSISLSGIQNASGVQKLTADLGNCDKDDVNLEQIANLPDLTDLTLIHLGKCRNANLPGLLRAPRLHKLNLDLTGAALSQFPDLLALQELKTLTLDCRFSELTRLPALPPGLRNLNLLVDDSKVNDLTSLTALSELDTLTLSTSQLDMQDLSTILHAVRTVHQLTLYLHGSPLQGLPDVSRIQGLWSLSLHLEGSRIANTSGLEKVQGLQQLSLFLDFAEFSGLSLRSIPGVRVLEVSFRGTGIRQLPQLPDHLTDLTLDLAGSQVRQLPVFLSSNLATLNLRLSPVQSLAGIERLAGLENLTLDVSSSGITDLEPLASLHQLKTLDLRLNWSQIGEIRNLVGLQNLHNLSLHLAGAGTQNLGYLNQLKNIEKLTLDFGYMEARSFPDISGMTNLRDLSVNLSKTQMEDISKLAALQELQALDLNVSNSEFQKLPAFDKLTHLHTAKLDISHSRIADLGQIQELNVLQDLTLDSHYRSLRQMPQSVKKLTVIQ